MQVKVTLDGSKITNVAVVQQTNDGQESQPIDSFSIPKLTAETLTAQSARIDSVSGATATSPATSGPCRAPSTRPPPDAAVDEPAPSAIRLEQVLRNDRLMAISAATGTAISEGCAVTIALTTDQQDLAAAVAGFTARHAAIAATRAAFDALAAGQLQPSWQALVGQRLHAIHLPESAGGDGAGLVELAVVLEQAAFGLFPGPLLPTVLAGQLIAEHAPRAAGRPAAARPGVRRDRGQRAHRGGAPR